MQLLLVHSPLITTKTWQALTPCLVNAGFEPTVVTLDNEADSNSQLYQHHLNQIENSMASLTKQDVIAVVHSGAGNLLAAMDPARFEHLVFLDAIFPNTAASRFDLFDDPSLVQGWRGLAAEHQGRLPRSVLAGFGEQFENPDLKKEFVTSLADVPIKLYEEVVPTHEYWPPTGKGVYFQWSESYAADAERAKQAGFEVLHTSGSHFRVLNEPNLVADELLNALT